MKLFPPGIFVNSGAVVEAVKKRYSIIITSDKTIVKVETVVLFFTVKFLFLVTGDLYCTS